MSNDKINGIVVKSNHSVHLRCVGLSVVPRVSGFPLPSSDFWHVCMPLILKAPCSSLVSDYRHIQTQGQHVDPEWIGRSVVNSEEPHRHLDRPSRTRYKIPRKVPLLFSPEIKRICQAVCQSDHPMRIEHLFEFIQPVSIPFLEHIERSNIIDLDSSIWP